MLAILFALCGILLCGRGFHLDLDALAAHNKIEHDASLVHQDAAPGNFNAPVAVDYELLQDLLGYASQNHGLTLEDFARVRSDREGKLVKQLDALHSEIACGESVMTWLLLKNENNEVPLEILSQWYGEERIPEGWKPPKEVVGLLKVRKHVKMLVAMKKGHAPSSRSGPAITTNV